MTRRTQSLSIPSKMKTTYFKVVKRNKAKKFPADLFTSTKESLQDFGFREVEQLIC